MEKDADAFRTISEVGEELDLPQHVLRFWETRFTQIKPIKRGGGRRYYRPDDVDLLRGIKHLLYAEGYTIKGVQRILREENPRFVQAVGREGRMPPLGEPLDRDHAGDQHSGDAHSFDAHSIDVGFGDLSDAIDEAVGAIHQPPIEPVVPSRRIEPAFAASTPVNLPLQEPHLLEPHLPEPPLHVPPLNLPPSAGVAARHEPSFAAPAPDHALFAAEASEPVAVPRKVKPKQLALFEGMGDEGLSAKDREALRTVLERIDECRKILASADLAKIPQTADH